MAETYAPAKGKLRETNFLKRIRSLRGIGAKGLDAHLDWTPREVVESLSPSDFKKEIAGIRKAVGDFDDDLKDHIDEWKREHPAVKKLIEYVELYSGFWEWLEGEVKKYPDNWKENCEFPWSIPFGWHRKFARHTLRQVLREIEDKLINARKVLRKEYKIEL